MTAREVQQSVNQRLSLEVHEIPQDLASAEVSLAVRIAPGASQRALARDLNGQRGAVPGQDTAPRSK
jgi:hypothetical protein